MSNSDIALVRNPNTGRFDFDWTDSNDLAFDDTNTHAVLSVLLEWRAAWWADTEGVRGSLLHTVKHDNKATRSTIESYARDALRKLVLAGKISNVEVTAQRTSPGRYDVLVRWKNPDGSTPSTTVSI